MSLSECFIGYLKNHTKFELPLSSQFDLTVLKIKTKISVILILMELLCWTEIGRKL
jgi:hypothetical protein